MCGASAEEIVGGVQAYTGSFDFIIDTVSAPHDINAFLNLLGRDGNLTVVGISEKPFEVYPGLLFRRRSLSSLNLGGIAETQEMLDFCGENDIKAEIEPIPIQSINQACDRMAHAPTRSDTDRDFWLWTGKALGRPVRGNSTGRRDLVPTRRKALERCNLEHRHGARCDSRTTRGHRRLARAGQRRTIPGVKLARAQEKSLLF